MQAFKESLGVAKGALLDSKYGENELFSLSLATHPEPPRRGAGTILCKGGMAKAGEEGLAVTLLQAGWRKCCIKSWVSSRGE